MGVVFEHGKYSAGELYIIHDLRYVEISLENSLRGVAHNPKHGMRMHSKYA